MTYPITGYISYGLGKYEYRIELDDDMPSNQRYRSSIVSIEDGELVCHQFFEGSARQEVEQKAKLYIDKLTSN